MASVTSWIRIEPRARDADLAPGMEARIHDPLWLVARQWQLGELDGDDAGSAIAATTEIELARIDALRVGGGAQRPVDVATTPLEIVAHAADTGPSLGERIRRGRALLRALARSGAPHAEFLTRYPLQLGEPAQPADRRLHAAMLGRVPDGAAAALELATLLAAGELPAELALGVHAAAASAACRTWLASDPIARTGASAWREDRLAHAFELRAGPYTLEASHQTTPSVHWYDVDVVEVGAAPIASSPPVTALPTHVRYRGMPSRRYWELEDGAVHWPAIDAGAGDVARLLFIEYALTFADDWLAVPVDIQLGSVSRVRSLVVTDTFGRRCIVRSAAHRDGPSGVWRFCEATTPSTGPLLVTLPEAPGLLVGRAVDLATIARDDQANVCWGVERVRQAADGRPRDVSLVPPNPAGTAGLRYQLGPAIADAFHPYLDRVDDDGPSLFRTGIPGSSTAAAHAVLPMVLDGASAPAHPVDVARVAIVLRSSDGAYHAAWARAASYAPATPPTPPLAFDRIASDQER